jgi:2-C-methyl-D-erythritol 4-phosphate cytidylyltransferase / 2-C-methyl-D-erythritol 2,4-cyclodiphosphate synthase
MRCWSIIIAAHAPAASKSLVYKPLGSRCLLAWPLRAFDRAGSVEAIILVVSPEDRDQAQTALGQACCQKQIVMSEAGNERCVSIETALALVPEDVDVVVVHDGARPLVSPQLIDSVVERAGECGAALVAVPARGTVLEGDKLVKRTLRSGDIWLAQTPQAFSRKLLSEAYAGFTGLATDEATVVEHHGSLMAIVPGDVDNLRVLTDSDLLWAESILKLQLSGMPQSGASTAVATTAPGRGGATASTPRSGIGFDSAALVVERRLVLAGMVLPHPKGLQGSGDADVLCRGVADALLGAAGLGDLKRRSSTAAAETNYSAELLRQVVADVREAGFEVANIDAILLGKPSALSQHLPGMVDNLARALKVSNDNVTLKITSGSAFGQSAEAESITAVATALLLPVDSNT